ncbi:MAG: outer membrane protein assembly factor BamD, partial [Candidatus Eisenbacteria bacterium]|nr:outer membrane protein assembly factor BamD [Candidatus Eisenbacteria bacterium]
MTRTSLLSATLTVLLALVMWGCSPMPKFEELTVSETYDVGAAALDDGDLLVATEAFRRITDDSPMHELAADALLGLADTHRQLGDYASAEEAYRRLTIEYPRSPLVAEAEYKLGLSYYEQSPPAALDQQMTRRAIRQLRSFTEDHPDSPFVRDAVEKMDELRSRLAKKDYDNGLLYLTLESPDAARVYFEAVAEDYPDTVWARRALLEVARIHRRAGSA